MEHLDTETCGGRCGLILGTATGYLGDRHSAGRWHRIRRPDLDGVQCRRTATNVPTGTARLPGSFHRRLWELSSRKAALVAGSAHSLDAIALRRPIGEGR